MALESFEAIVDDFEFLETWEDRYRYVIDLGKTLPELQEDLRRPTTKVDGCASQVWIVPEILQPGLESVFRFQGDSDAIIVRGLISILQSLYNGLSVREVLSVKAQEELGRLGLQNHLSSQRSNGLAAMVSRIGMLAQAMASA